MSSFGLVHPLSFGIPMPVRKTVWYSMENCQNFSRNYPCQPAVFDSDWRRRWARVWGTLEDLLHCWAHRATKSNDKLLIKCHQNAFTPVYLYTKPHCMRARITGQASNSRLDSTTHTRLDSNVPWKDEQGYQGQTDFREQPNILLDRKTFNICRGSISRASIRC